MPAFREMPNTACTGRWRFVAIYEHFAETLPRHWLQVFLLPNRIHTRPKRGPAPPLDRRPHPVDNPHWDQNKDQSAELIMLHIRCYTTKWRLSTP
jgi:hypothetical protein